jgi:hypothetical protein
MDLNQQELQQRLKEYSLKEWQPTNVAPTSLENSAKVVAKTTYLKCWKAIKCHPAI